MDVYDFIDECKEAGYKVTENKRYNVVITKKSSMKIMISIYPYKIIVSCYALNPQTRTYNVLCLKKKSDINWDEILEMIKDAKPISKDEKLHVKWHDFNTKSFYTSNKYGCVFIPNTIKTANVQSVYYINDNGIICEHNADTNDKDAYFYIHSTKLDDSNFDIVYDGTRYATLRKAGKAMQIDNTQATELNGIDKTLIDLAIKVFLREDDDVR